MLTGDLSPWPCFTDEEAKAVTRVLLSNRVNAWTGSECREFEAEFARYCGTQYAITLANGTVSLELALEAAGIGAGDDVITTPRTFIASASCIVRRGGKPIFADICPDSQNITPATIEAAVTPATRAVIVVHHAGWPCDMPAIMELAERHSLIVIEDCAQAHGAMLSGRRVGSFGHFGSFSFCQDKIMTTGGEGGMLLTDDPKLWSAAWSIKDHGKSYEAVFHREHPPGFKWLHEDFGTNFRMTEMQAAIGRIQLQRLDDWLVRREENAKTIRRVLDRFPVFRTPWPVEGTRHAFYRLYTFVNSDYLADGWSRDRIAAEIIASGIPCLTGSCAAIYRERAFRKSGLVPPQPMAIAESIGPASLAFLVHPSIDATDMKRITSVLESVAIRACRKRASALKC